MSETERIAKDWTVNIQLTVKTERKTMSETEGWTTAKDWTVYNLTVKDWTEDDVKDWKVDNCQRLNGTPLTAKNWTEDNVKHWKVDSCQRLNGKQLNSERLNGRQCQRLRGEQLPMTERYTS